MCIRDRPLAAQAEILAVKSLGGLHHRDAMIGVIPVSYTHLDVYKRQVHEVLVERAEMGQFLQCQRGVTCPVQREDHRPRLFAHRVWRRNIGHLAGGVAFQILVIDCIDPVSYTHLDVYKRQAPTILLGLLQVLWKHDGMDGVQ